MAVLLSMALPPGKALTSHTPNTKLYEAIVLRSAQLHSTGTVRAQRQWPEGGLRYSLQDKAPTTHIPRRAYSSKVSAYFGANYP